MLSNSSNAFSIESSRVDASYLLSKELKNLLLNKYEYHKDIIVLCIGTDRSTGDCLGPLVGDKLSRLRLNSRVSVLGTLKNPIHAKNLEEMSSQILMKHTDPLIIAVDASLGRTENVGKINLYNGPVYPGSGVNKKLEPIGDVSITGIVNISGFMEYMVLQSTRLSLVMCMADIISTSIFISISKLCPYQYVSEEDRFFAK